MIIPGLNLAQTVVAGLAMITGLVVVHEFGHFVFARLFGIGTPVFSIGLGPRVFGFNFLKTDFRLSALPFGGYVRLAGADPFGEEDPSGWIDPREDFMKKPIWQRLIVMAAGPTFSLLLSPVLFALVLMGGEPQPDRSVGMVEPGRLAEQVGLRAGDVVRSVDGKPVSTWLDFLADLAHHAGEKVDLVVEREGRELAIALPAGAFSLDDDGTAELDSLGLYHSRLSARVGVDDPSSPAGKAGLHTGDAVVGVDGTEVKTWDDLERALTAEGTHDLKVLRAKDGVVGEVPPIRISADPSWRPREGDPAADQYGLVPALLFVGEVTKECGDPPRPCAAITAGVQADDRLWSVDGTIVKSWSDLIELVGATVAEHTSDATPRALDLVVYRDGQRIELQFTPQVQRDVILGDVRWRPVMGIRQYPDVFVDGPEVAWYYPIWQAVPLALSEVRMVLHATSAAFRNLLIGQLGWRESVGGPVAIFRAAGGAAQGGLFTFARLMGSLTFGIGMANFLPIPVLDGGQILFYAIEGIRGRPLSIALRERVQAIGVLAIVAMMLLVTANDLLRP